MGLKTRVRTTQAGPVAGPALLLRRRKAKTRSNPNGKDAGTVGLWTDHPRPWVVEWHVDFAKVADEGYPGL